MDDRIDGLSRRQLVRLLRWGASVGGYPARSELLAVAADEIERLAARVAELERDAARLDAIERGQVNVSVGALSPLWRARHLAGPEFASDTLRGAIDRAMGSNSGGRD